MEAETGTFCARAARAGLDFDIWFASVGAALFYCHFVLFCLLASYSTDETRDAGSTRAFLLCFFMRPVSHPQHFSFPLQVWWPRLPSRPARRWRWRLSWWWWWRWLGRQRRWWRRRRLGRRRRRWRLGWRRRRWPRGPWWRLVINSSAPIASSFGVSQDMRSSGGRRVFTHSPQAAISHPLLSCFTSYPSRAPDLGLASNAMRARAASGVHNVPHFIFYTYVLSINSIKRLRRLASQLFYTKTNTTLPK